LEVKTFELRRFDDSLPPSIGVHAMLFTPLPNRIFAAAAHAKVRLIYLSRAAGRCCFLSLSLFLSAASFTRSPHHAAIARAQHVC
jgi:hypothetical protein